MPRLKCLLIRVRLIILSLMLGKGVKRMFVIKCSKGYMEEFHKAMLEAVEQYKYEDMNTLKVYAFTNLGLVKVEVLRDRIDKFTNKPQFRVSVEGKEYNYWFTKDQLFSSKFKAILSLLK